MNDLLYTGDFEISKELETKIKTNFPEAKTEISYDEIHENRLSVELLDVKRKEYLKLIIKSRYDNISFYIQMVINAPNFKLPNEKQLAEKLQEIKDILAEIEKEGREVNLC